MFRIRFSFQSNPSFDELYLIVSNLICMKLHNSVDGYLALMEAADASLAAVVCVTSSDIVRRF